VHGCNSDPNDGSRMLGMDSIQSLYADWVSVVGDH